MNAVAYFEQKEQLAQYIQLDTLVPSTTNPRKKFDESTLTELSKSIEKYGVLQPILVQLHPAEKGKYEIIAGERRYRASKLANQTAIPARIVTVTPLEMLELQVIENLQREDIHPLEEAEGYETLLKSSKMITVDDIAIRLGKSRSYIYARMKLCALSAKSRKAFYDDKLSPSTALLLARIPNKKLQEQALEEITNVHAYGRDPVMSVREAQQHIQRNYMTDLGDAPFDIKSKALDIKAGSCTDCKKRTGAQPDLFNDIKSADVCTDSVCFNNKKQLHVNLLSIELEEKGIKIIRGDEAKEIKRFSYSDSLKGYCPANSKCYEVPTDKLKTYEQLLKKSDIEPVYIEDADKGTLIKAYPDKQVKQALQEQGYEMPSAGRNAGEAQERKRIKAERAYRTDLFHKTHAAIKERLNGHCLTQHDVQLFAQTMFRGFHHEERKALYACYGLDKDTNDFPGQIDLMSIEEATVAMFTMALVSDAQYSTYSSGEPNTLIRIAQQFGVNTDRPDRKTETNRSKNNGIS